MLIFQIFPAPQAPWFFAGFATSCATLSFTCLGFASLPLWLLAEAKYRKKKTGHAMPFRALEDAAHAMVSEGVRIAEEEQKRREEQMIEKNNGEVAHLENVA
jgi:hypothetical protein